MGEEQTQPQGQTIPPEPKKEDTMTKRQAAYEVILVQKRNRMLSGFSGACAFVGVVLLFMKSGYWGAAFCFGSAFVALWTMFSVDRAIHTLAKKYGFPESKLTDMIARK